MSENTLTLIATVILAIIVCVGGYAFNSYKCKNFATISGYSNYNFSIINGCFVEVNGKMVNKDMLREVSK
ncbi:MAG: hypothetical protein KBC72_00375 [Acinetobacter sp.]|nr:hypothetical protein [Acinetobacter sp.]